VGAPSAYVRAGFPAISRLFPAISRLFPAIFLLCLRRKGSKASGGGAGGGGKGRGGRRADEVQVAKKEGLGFRV